jgi:hypothetical protein
MISAESRPTRSQVRSQAVYSSSGKVYRHVMMGGSEESKREVRRREDEASLAGMRNPASVVRGWPELSNAMLPVRDAILKAINLAPDLRGLSGACGPTPSRAPPTSTSIRRVRRKVAEALELSVEEAEVSHPASPWKAAWWAVSNISLPIPT